MTNFQYGSIVVNLHFSAFSNTSSRVASIWMRPFDVSGIGRFTSGRILRRAYMEVKR